MTSLASSSSPQSAAELVRLSGLVQRSVLHPHHPAGAVRTQSTARQGTRTRSGREETMGKSHFPSPSPSLCRASYAGCTGAGGLPKLRKLCLIGMLWASAAVHKLADSEQCIWHLQLHTAVIALVLLADHMRTIRTAGAVTWGV